MKPIDTLERSTPPQGNSGWGHMFPCRIQRSDGFAPMNSLINTDEAIATQSRPIAVPGPDTDADRDLLPIRPTIRNGKLPIWDRAGANFEADQAAAATSPRRATTRSPFAPASTRSRGRRTASTPPGRRSVIVASKSARPSPASCSEGPRAHPRDDSCRIGI